MRQRKRTQRRWLGAREELSFLFNSMHTLEWIYSEIGYLLLGKHPNSFGVFGAFPTALENLRERFIRTPGRTHNRIRSPR